MLCETSDILEAFLVGVSSELNAGM